MKRTHRVNLALVAGAAVVSMVIAACGGSSGTGSGAGASPSAASSSAAALTASAPGITPTTITIGSHQPLTGPAAPGYSEIAPASKAYFDYVNSRGGVFGRKIVYKYLNDQYNPTSTSNVVHQLVLQDNVYAIFDGLGTLTHLAVAQYLNSSKVPDVFVASGCECWNAPAKWPYTFGWQTDYIREGKILGNYVKQHFKGKKIGYFYQNDEFGQDGVKGLNMEIPKSQVVAKESYNTANINVGPQVAALKAAGAQVVVSFSVPTWTALLRLTGLKLQFKPQLVVSTVGSDPTTLGGLLASFGKSKKLSGLTQGIITDGYLPSLGDTSNSWIALFKKIHEPVHPEAAVRRQRGVRPGGRLHVRPGDVQGRPEPDQAGPGQRHPGGPAAGPVGGAVRLLADRPQRHDRGVHGRHQERGVCQEGPGAGHRHQPGRRDHLGHGNPAGRSGQRDTGTMTGRRGAACGLPPGAPGKEISETGVPP